MPSSPRFLRLFSLTSLLLLLISSSCDAEVPSPTHEDTAARIQGGIAKLNELYWSPTLSIWLDRPGDDLRAHYDGRRNPPWWPSANAVEMLVDFMSATGNSEYDAPIETLYELQKNPRERRSRVVAELKRRGQWTDADERARERELEKAAPAVSTGYYSDFQNEYLDDSAWWGISWLKMYDRTGGEKYLATARTIQAHMAKNWKPEQDGGIMWSEDADKQRPNAITNSLFLILSARLYIRTGEAAYLDWAEKTLEWFHTRKLYDGIAVVDAPGHNGDYWSYNQGTFIGGLVALYQATGRIGYLEEAAKVAETILHHSGLALPSGVITEKLGSGGDSALFKGIYVRYLGQLRRELEEGHQHLEVAAEVRRQLQCSVESLLRHSLTPGGLFSAEWHEGAKDRSLSFNTQVSALTALVAFLDERH